MLPDIKIKRAYEDASEEDGYRILVDRLWPRGITKEALHIDEWAKDIAPSGDLRRWYGHKPERWQEFRRDYIKELQANKAIDEFVKQFKKHSVITLIYAVKDAEHSNAAVLSEYLQKKF